MRIDAFRSSGEFKKDMDQWLKRFRQAKPARDFDQVFVPGDPERIMEMQRMKQGIPLLHAVVEDLQYLANRFKISLPR
jgi:LDH2 family malate/lactate/ureidoglycolate dehydrogenase